MGPIELPASGPVYLDSSAVIYLIERVPPYAAVLDSVWSAAEQGQVQLLGSVLVLLEVLVKPLQDANALLCDVYRDALLRSHEFRLLDVDPVIAERAAQIRAETRLRIPDATHAATALQAGAGLFITNDAGFRRVPGLPLALLSDSVPRIPIATEPGAGPTADQGPQRFPMRAVSGRHEVLIVPENMWLACGSQEDAEIIASAPLLQDAALSGSRTGAAFAKELQELSEALRRHRVGLGERFFAHYAEKYRTEQS